MRTESNILIADPGYYLTQANRKEEERPDLLSKVYLSEYDSAANYMEVTIEEGERMLREWEEKYLIPEEPVFI